MAGDNKPSRVLSEGEQRSLEIADFIAEVKMSDQKVPVVFDDPVSSLDHRRLGEVAARIADLAKDRQVVVFSHDIFFVCSLLALMEPPSVCIYYQVTDEDGNGTVARGNGPRWDTVSKLTGRVNDSIQKAKSASGEKREHLVREGYSWIRSWCEVFVEREVLAQVTERYQPNVRMTALADIKVSVLDDTREIVASVFADACRYIEGHSQPLPSLGVAPTLTRLESDWAKLTECREKHRKVVK
jgi:ABC-type multidrug transport system ATPase subunit